MAKTKATKATSPEGETILEDFEQLKVKATRFSWLNRKEMTIENVLEEKGNPGHLRRDWEPIDGELINILQHKKIMVENLVARNGEDELAGDGVQDVLPVAPPEPEVVDLTAEAEGSDDEDPDGSVLDPPIWK